MNTDTVVKPSQLYGRILKYTYDGVLIGGFSTTPGVRKRRADRKRQRQNRKARS